ncbi:MAG: inositol monophosphatase [Candidatus Levybacteria bacterium]|nr:inositol monophosphatase [Candidatus Levybacteria bacterium]
MRNKRNQHSRLNLAETLDFASHVALAAGGKLRAEFYKRESRAITKGDFDFNTEVEIKIDAIITSMLKRRFTTMQILTEETAPEDYSHMQSVDRLWIVDPLDGTTNFLRRRPHFAVSIALVEKGMPLAAVIYLPMQDELYTAQADSPYAFLNGQVIHVSGTSTLRETWIESGISWDMTKRKVFAKEWFPPLSQNVRAFTMSGSAVFDLAAVAKGEVDGFVFCGIKPWDQAAAGLLIQKAGGKITTSYGKKWNAFAKDIVASNGLIHGDLVNLTLSNKFF